MANSFLLGLDVGSSSIKCALVAVDTGRCVARAQSPAEEMAIRAPHPGWAEQQPEDWWQHTVAAVREAIHKSEATPSEIKAIGISYQMHGLVAIDQEGVPVRPSIIWCDSRAVPTGERAARQLGHHFCLQHYLNLPANFTAAKLRWVMENEPGVFERIATFFLPGDYIAFRLTGQRTTTVSGLSEAILWDFREQRLAHELLSMWDIPPHLVPPVTDTFGVQGMLTEAAARELGLPSGTPVSYRAGDQPNNTFSLNVLRPGEIAATAGTSGVIYSVTDRQAVDAHARVNTFVHVTHAPAHPRYGILLCVNGTGSANRWLRQMTGIEDYRAMNHLGADVGIGSDGLTVLPFGNGAERLLKNQPLGASVQHVDFNRHSRAHLCRAVQEGIVFALAYGHQIVQQVGSPTRIIRAGHANMFLSPLFREAFVNTLNAPLELFDTDGATGAALGAGVGAGLYTTSDAFVGLTRLSVTEPDARLVSRYQEAYQNWLAVLSSHVTLS
ncbi:MAG: FGGY family carbohydrate kinase [Cyclobacteriaceae bacterium]|jgi:xylulokinase|nr:FGGY family carbohydrate kinase [Cyclobacteriaceae bacterium]